MAAGERRGRGPGRAVRPHGTVAAARRHQRAGEELCGPCAEAWRQHQHRQYLRRRAAR